MRKRCPPRTALAFLLALGGAPGNAGAAMIRVPQDFPGIQAAINAAQNGDTVLVAPGTHTGGLSITGKAVTLASHFILTADTADVSRTTIAGGSPILKIFASAGASTTVLGLTFRDGNYQIVNHARRVSLLNNRFFGGSGDQVSFEAAGGLVRECWFENATDDGVDCDDASDPTIEMNTILNARDDGIEVRLQPFTGPPRYVVIRANLISGCREDGIQLIDYPGASSRVFWIENNVIANNAKAGLGCMENGNTTENSASSPPVSVGDGPRDSGFALTGVRPNPSRSGFAVEFTLPGPAPARIEVLDLAGRRILARELAGHGPGSHVVNLSETRALPAGLYLVRLSQGGRSRTVRGVVVR